MAATVLPGFAEVGLAHLLQIIEAHIYWLTTHLFQQLFSVCHRAMMVPLMAPYVNSILPLSVVSEVCAASLEGVPELPLPLHSRVSLHYRRAYLTGNFG